VFAVCLQPRRSATVNVGAPGSLVGNAIPPRSTEEADTLSVRHFPQRCMIHDIGSASGRAPNAVISIDAARPFSCPLVLGGSHAVHR
jgi:hypothetical protein